MTPRHIGAWLLKRWPIVGGILLLVAFLVGMAVGSSGSRDIRAQAEPTLVVITEETMHLLPPFDPNAIPTIVPPPCAERLESKYKTLYGIVLGYTRENCTIRLDDEYLTETQADEYIAKREAEKREQATLSALVDEEAAFRAYLASIRSITLNNGSIIELPDDVRITDEIFRMVYCVERKFCPQAPFLKLERGDSYVWIDGNGVVFNFRGGDEDRADFPFLTKHETQ